MNQSERRRYLIRQLLDENREYRGAAIPDDAGEQRLLLRGLMNVRPPQDADEEFLAVQDEYLSEETRRKGITDIDDLEPACELDAAGRLYLWQGDITTIRCDAIVNAANSGMTGCYVPNHRCIDNCIHTYAGVQLRQDCARIMTRQGHAEPTGTAKITPAYNLPCRYVLHTVGPIIYGEPSEEDCELLASCYRSCLSLAAERGLESIAFCCISTGEFHFPNDSAADIAVRTVMQFLTQNPSASVKKVVFNVFRNADREIYEQLLTDYGEP